MDDERFKPDLIAQEQKISPVVVAATVLIIVLLSIGLLYQLLLFIGLL